MPACGRQAEHDATGGDGPLSSSLRLVRFACLRVLCGCALALLAASCSKNAGKPAAPASQSAATGQFVFHKTGIGLPGTALDFLGENPPGLAGARAARSVLFAAQVEKKQMLYARNLRSGRRQFLGSVDGLVPGTLAVSPDGRFAVYCRMRPIAAVIDDPAVTEPANVAVPVGMDTASGREIPLFDFGSPELRVYRSDTVAPFITPDGKQVYVLAYDFDRLLLAKHLKDWVGYEQDYRKAHKKLSEKDRAEREKTMRALTQSSRVAPLLAQLNVEPSATGAIPAAEADAMAKLAHEYGADPFHLVLLIWEGGKTQVLPLAFAGPHRAYYFIFAVGRGTVLIAEQRLKQEELRPQQIYKVDLASGAVTPFATYFGLLTSAECSADGQNLLVLYNPLDSGRRQILTETHLMRLPLNGAASSETALGADLLGYADMTSDGSFVAGQSRDDGNLYIVDAATGQKRLLCKLLGTLQGIFLADPGSDLVYLEKGILFHVSIPRDPELSSAWQGETAFARYREPVFAFLGRLGMQMPQDCEVTWEERDGLGSHEVAARIAVPQSRTMPVFARYAVDAGKVISVWFPQGPPLPLPDEAHGKKLDYYGCRDLAVKALDRVGWLPGGTRVEFKPGPNPLYDAPSDTYFVVYRDGYWMGRGDKAAWVINKEATVRVVAGTGAISEMTLLELPPVSSQPRTITLARAEFVIRNQGTMKIPEKAPIRFDEKNVRLVVAQHRDFAWGPAQYTARLESRLCYELDMYIQPENELILSSRVDTETGELLGELNYQPSNILPVRPG